VEIEILETFALFGSLIWLVIFFLPWRPWSTREALHSTPPLREADEVDLSEVTVLIPARNEEDSIGRTLASVKAQGDKVSVVLVDDESTDRTLEVAHQSGIQKLKAIRGTSLPAGWAGKLWALEQGRVQVNTPYTLLLDADIELTPGMLSTLLRKLKADNLDFVSMMAELKMETFWEKLLIPAFIYFFKLVYPFAWGNSPRTRFGVAAGGCVLVRTLALDKIGGFGAIKSAIIDDCSLAQKMKIHGFRTFIGLTRSVKSHRDYSDLSSIWNMVARSAFTQLFYSNLLLMVVTFVMLSMFVMPWLILAFDVDGWTKILCVAGLGLMTATYLPTLKFYRINPMWALTMPIIGVLYLAMTWTSAIRYWRGMRSIWKNRVYSSKEAA